MDRAVGAYVCPPPRPPTATPRKGKTPLHDKQRTESFLKIRPFNVSSGAAADGQAGEPEQLLPDLGEVAGDGFPSREAARPQAQKQAPSAVPFISPCPFGHQPPDRRPRATSGAQGLLVGGRDRGFWASLPSLPLLHFREGLALASTRGAARISPRPCTLRARCTEGPRVPLPSSQQRGGPAKCVIPG